ncbi:pollen Ole e 1 allergen and extensin family protein [Actinidia rufa]|uniref:Pollen Ole e 1 allergen and extensin family protein n=1 Tax=Actinidia rufa TaxID=165716 RepID=A0A7J0D9P5_9ERIC|nr:pollen Ole e 1 allergen and extensin family protein [Actinidia rufa]
MYLFLSVLSFTFSNLSEAKHQNKLSSAVVVGTVYCDTCFQADFSKTSHFISGGTTSSKPSFREEVKTNKHGKFKVHLPFSVTKHVKKIEGCSAKLISSSEPYCAVASTATSSFRSISTKCSQFQETIHSTTCGSNNSTPNNPDSIPVDQYLLPPLPGLPRLPPLPELPPLPPLSGLPNFPPSSKKSTESKSVSNGKVAKQQLPGIPLFPSPPPALGISLPPNPFLLPPNPFQAPPLTLPPNPFQPLPPLFNAPPIPGSTPSLPPPGFALPPFPFQPSPGFPGIPSAKNTSP